jgi:hypothetical protein
VEEDRQRPDWRRGGCCYHHDHHHAPQSGPRPLRVGITGHTDLGAETVRLVDGELGRHLRGLRSDSSAETCSLIGVSCLAPGADCVFADVVLRLGGLLEVILPWAGYAGSRVPGYHAAGYGALLQRASSVRAAGAAAAKTEPQAYAAANSLMLDSVDRLIAVWNGVPSRKLGGTADAVSAAKARRMPVTVIWPEGSRRG